MKAIIKEDRIIKISEKGSGIEIGRIPRDVGLDQMRWTGSKLINLANLKQMYVEPGTHILHVIPIPGSQLISMNWSDRRHLIDDAGIVRVKTAGEIAKPKLEEYKAKRRQAYPDIGDQLDAILTYLNSLGHLPKELQDIIDKTIQIKDKFPKGV